MLGGVKRIRKLAQGNIPAQLDERGGARKNGFNLKVSAAEIDRQPLHQNGWAHLPAHLTIQPVNHFMVGNLRSATAGIVLIQIRNIDRVGGKSAMPQNTRQEN